MPFCKHCGTNYNDDAAFCKECGKPIEKQAAQPKEIIPERARRKYWFFIPLLVVVVAVVWYISSTRWTKDFDLKYVDYVGASEKGNLSGSSYYLYEITNNTNHTLKDVSVVILVDDVGGDFKYEDSVASSIKPGETVEYRLYTKDYEEAAENKTSRLYLLVE